MTKAKPKTKPTKLAQASKAKAKPKAARAAPKKKARPAAPTGPAVPVGSKLEEDLRAYALSFPGAVEEFPWGDRVMKVNKKVFVFMGTHDGTFGMSTKLARSAAIALTLPFAAPTRYGLGKSGWVTAQFATTERPPLDLLRAWIEESYRSIAPQRLVGSLAR